MRIVSFGISALLVVLAGCAGSNGASSSSAADTTGSTLDPTPTVVMSIPDAVSALESAEILPGPGHDDAVAASGATPLDAIKAYVDHEHGSDPVKGSAFELVENADAFAFDAPVAGTFTTDVAIREVLAAIDGNDKTHDENVSVNRGDEVRGIMESIAAAGGSFGFDGDGQNGCAAPTAMLLVIDPADATVYAVDLNPCSED